MMLRNFYKDHGFRLILKLYLLMLYYQYLLIILIQFNIFLSYLLNPSLNSLIIIFLFFISQLLLLVYLFLILK